MTPENFVYWLQGFLELSHQTSLDEIQTKVIRDHLALVFDKKTPTMHGIDFDSHLVFRPYKQHTQSGQMEKIDLSHTHIWGT